MTKKTNREEEDRENFRKYNIFFRRPASESEFPAHHKISFDKILELGRTRFQTYCQNDDETSSFWRAETKGHAQHLVETTSRLARNRASEMKWRLDLEKIVYKRFELEIDCPEPACRRRWWRSETEVVPEVQGPISSMLDRRRANRSACDCSAETRLQNLNMPRLNRLFDFRAEEAILHGGEAQSRIHNKRKPDTIYGLQGTNLLNQQLEAISRQIQSQVSEETQVAGSASAIRFTPFKKRERPLIFPFLISEAKTERGDSFEQCEAQTAFPIWNLLRLQEELQIYSKKGLDEQGGPLVWFFANRGEDWRLYGCYTDTVIGDHQTESSRTSYNIMLLWQGRVDSRNGALQILLLVDYIFDWARDLYRPGIIQLLKTLSRSNFDDSASISTDFDIISTRRRVDDLLWDSNSTPRPARNYDNHRLARLMFEDWKRTDTIEGVFRNASLIEMSCQLIDFTKFTLSDLRTHMEATEFAKDLHDLHQMLLARCVAQALMISHDVLTHLVSQWLDARSDINEDTDFTTDKYAIISYHTDTSREWQPRRILQIMLFSQSVIEDLFEAVFELPLQTSIQEFIRLGREYMTGRLKIPAGHHTFFHRLGEWSGGLTKFVVELSPISIEDTTELVAILKSESITGTFAAALDSRAIAVMRTSNLLAGNKFLFFQYSKIYSSFCTMLARGLPVFNTTTRFSTTSFELANPVATLVAPVASKLTSPLDSLSARCVLRQHFPRTLPKLLLVYSDEIQDINPQAAKWCIFSLGAPTGAPTTNDQLDMLSSVTGDGFCVVTHSKSKKPVEMMWMAFDPARALEQWRAILGDINTIHEISKLANMDAPALSRLIKRSMYDEVSLMKRSVYDEVNHRASSKRAKLDISKLKEMMEEEYPVTEERPPSIVH